MKDIPAHSQCPRCGGEWMDHKDEAEGLMKRCGRGCGMLVRKSGAYLCQVGEYDINWFVHVGFMIFDNSGKSIYKGEPLSYDVILEQIEMALVFQ